MPSRVFRITVRGTMRFPLDMLRYDACFPETGADVAAIAASLDRGVNETEVNLLHRTDDRKWTPTEGRWASFLWAVTRTEIVR